MSNKNEYFAPTQPITINTNKNRISNHFSSWSPMNGGMLNNSGNFGTFATSPSSNLPPISPVSPPSSLSSQVGSLNSSGLRRRMSLNIGVNSLATPFFQTTGTSTSPKMDLPNIENNPTPKPKPRRARTVSTSEVDAVNLAEKWGFGIKSQASSTMPSNYSPPSNARKTRADFLRQSASNMEARSKSPTRDMILEGHFLDMYSGYCL